LIVVQLELAAAAAVPIQRLPLSREDSASETRRAHRDSPAKEPTSGSKSKRSSRPASAEIPISMKSKSLQLLAMDPKAYKQQQQQQLQQNHL
jgi:hypothetical protein